jgi:hypothetical protein
MNKIKEIHQDFENKLKIKFEETDSQISRKIF